MTEVPLPALPKPAPVSKGREFWIIWFASWLLRLLMATLRFELETPELMSAVAAQETAIVVFWHNRLLLLPWVWHRYLGEGRPQGKALTSTSGDGELIAQFLLRFNVGPVRGSATRRGAGALRELAGWLQRGHHVAITPDGSRGPIYKVKPGMVKLAQLSGAPFLPIGIDYSRSWRLKSWDRFFIPKPFAKVTIRFGPLHYVPRTATEEEFAAERLRCEAMMLAVIRER